MSWALSRCRTESFVFKSIFVFLLLWVQQLPISGKRPLLHLQNLKDKFIALDDSIGVHNLTCKDYIPEQCYTEPVDHQGQMLPFNTSKIEGHNTTAAIIKCQKICNNTNGCQFFIYKDHTYDHHFNKSENLCELWNHTLSDYEAGCVQLGGPLSPASVEHCQNITNNISSCESFRDGSCIFEGSLLDHLRDIGDPDTCQLACQHDQNCHYFVHDKVTNDCQMLSNDNRSCSWIRGPPTPAYTSCLGNHEKS